MLLVALALAQALPPADQRGLRTTTPGWSPPYEEARLPELLRGKCQSDWPGDYFLQEACLRLQTDGMLHLKRIDERYGAKFNKPVEKCVDEWTKDGVPDFHLIAACAQLQIDSYHRINEPSAP